MRVLRITVSTLAALAAMVTILAAPVLGSEALGKQENVACTACHDKPGSKLLTDQGKYFELRRTMVGFDELKATFGKCTACHDTKPGSLALTEKGEQFRFIVVDMEGLADWMKQHHPTAPEKEPEPEKPAESEDGSK